MTIKILMPALSPTMKEGNLTKWHVKVGDEVKAGDILAEIETDKATMEIEAVDEGKITKIIIQEGAEGVAINSPIAILNGSDNDTKDNDNDKNEIETDVKSNVNKKKLKAKENLVKNKKINNKEQSTIYNKGIIASPFAKKIAKEKKINLNNLKGTGPKGRIIKRDFKNIDKEIQSIFTSSTYTTVEPSPIRKIIAEKTINTMNTVPHFYLTIESRVDRLLKLRKYINENNLNKKISINDIFVKAIALAQRKNPSSNVSWYKDQILQYSSVDVSVAIALKEGLVTPIIKNADKKGLLEISDEMKILVKKAKNGKLIPEDYNGGTITISNLGMYGINEFSAIINPPQSSILAVGAVQQKLVLEKEKINSANIIKSTLSADHRVLDGATAANLLKSFHDIIENPFELWINSNDMEII